jgi:endonuclease/exonuclease/phosphatase family metal-dependent hydrolase
MDWEVVRKHALIRKIVRMEPDVAALQEVDVDSLSFFDRALAQQARALLQRPVHYKRAYAQRDTAERFDGCVTYYSTDRFSLVLRRTVHLASVVERAEVTKLREQGTKNVRSYVDTMPSELDELLDRGNVGLLVALRDRRAPRDAAPIVVVNCHLLFSPSRGDVKLGQALALTISIRLFVEDVAAKAKVDVNDVPVVWCGDFNSTPESPLLRFVRDGVVAEGDMYLALLSGQFRRRDLRPSPHMGSLCREALRRWATAFFGEHPAAGEPVTPLTAEAPAPRVTETTTTAAAAAVAATVASSNGDDVGDDEAGEGDDPPADAVMCDADGDSLDDAAELTTATANPDTFHAALREPQQPTDSLLGLHHGLSFTSTMRKFERYPRVASIVRPLRWECRVVDYVLVNDNLRAVRALELPANTARHYPRLGIPSPDEPSDHLPLMLSLVVRRKGEREQQKE